MAKKKKRKVVLVSALEIALQNNGGALDSDAALIAAADSLATAGLIAQKNGDHATLVSIASGWFQIARALSEDADDIRQPIGFIPDREDIIERKD